MMVLLKTMLEISPAFIFLPGSRLTTKGFRWAPARWMGGWKIEFPDPLALPSKPMLFSWGYDVIQAPSVLTEDGLMVRYSGHHLHTASLISAVRSVLESSVFPTSDSLPE